MEINLYQFIRKIKKSLAFAGFFLYNELVITNISYTHNTKSSYT